MSQARHRLRIAILSTLSVLFGASQLACRVAAADARPDFMPEQGMPYAAFDGLAHTILHQHGSELVVGFAPGALALPQAEVLDWIQHASAIVAAYYDRFPVRSVRVLIVPVAGDDVRGGTTWAYRGAAIRILLGDRANALSLRQDWKLVHEMVHLALPNLDERQNWLSEGMATYIEPIARAQAGDLAPGRIWADMIADMPKGLPDGRGTGLDDTPGWATTYWGGARFCLLADIDIRKRTANRYGLQDAMRGVLAAGGNHEQNWPIERILRAGDKAVGTDSLERLYAEMATAPRSTDLDALWRALGIRKTGVRDASLADDQPLSAVRAAITDRAR